MQHKDKTNSVGGVGPRSLETEFYMTAAYVLQNRESMRYLYEWQRPFCLSLTLLPPSPQKKDKNAKKETSVHDPLQVRRMTRYRPSPP